MESENRAMNSPEAPEPTVMPIDRENWAKQLHLSNFINAFTQYRDLQLLPDCKTVLVVGPGQGFEVVTHRWRGYEVTTLDIDDTFKPDVLGSVHDMPMFGDARFDVVIASHVLEHMALPYLDPALKEIARVGRYALIYLPLHGRHGQVRFVPGVRGWDWAWTYSVFNPRETPDGVTPRYCLSQHFWEIGTKGFKVKDVLARMAPHFNVVRHYRNRDWMGSYNFVLQSRRHAR